MPNNFELPSSLTKKDYYLFALRTRLIPKLQQRLGKTIDIYFSKTSANTLADVLHIGYPNGKELYLSSDMHHELKELIESTTHTSMKEWCLLLDTDTTKIFIDEGRNKISSSWIRSIFPFITIGNVTDINNENILVPVKIEDEKLYINLVKFPEYKTKYVEILQDLQEDLKSKYHIGYTVNPSKTIVEKWKLKEIDRKESSKLYVPDGWTTSTNALVDVLASINTPLSLLFHEFANASKFKVSMNVGLNMVDYHYISERVFNGDFSFFIEEGKVFFTPKDLQDLLDKTSKINEIIHGNDVYGKVLCMYASRLSWMRIYALISQRSIPGKYTVYVRRDIRPMFVFSVKVPDDTDLDNIEYELRIRGDRLLLYLLEKLKPLDGDIHEALDNAAKLPQELELPENFLPEGLTREGLKEHNIIF